MEASLAHGPDGLARAAALARSAPLMALASFPAFDGDVGDGPPHLGPPLQLLALATRAGALVLDVARTPDLASLWAPGRPVAALGAQRLQHALWRAQAGAPARWACPALLAQVLQAPRPIVATLEALTADAGLGPAPAPDDSVAGLAERARQVLRLTEAQAEAIRGATLGAVARLEARAVVPVAALERAGLPFDGERLAGLLQQEQRRLATLGPEGADERRALEQLGRAVGRPWLARIDARGRLHASFVQIAAASGRMASRHPNVQALPKAGQRRTCVRAPAGRRLLVADYAACELRILAHRSGDAAYRRAFAAGEDVHRTVAARLFGRAHAGDVPDHERQAAKALSFGLVYGMQPRGLAARLGCSVAEAEGHMRQFFRAYPAIERHLEDSAAHDCRRGAVETSLGRRIALLPEDAQRHPRLARNLPIQGTGADVLKAAMVAVWREVEASAGAELVHSVHDSLMVLVDEAEAASMGERMREAMRQAAAALLPSVAWQVDLEQLIAWH